MKTAQMLPYLIVIQYLKCLNEGKGPTKGQKLYPRPYVQPGQTHPSSLKLKYTEFITGCKNTASSARCPDVEKSLPQLKTGIAIIDYIIDQPLGVENALKYIPHPACTTTIFMHIGRGSTNVNSVIKNFHSLVVLETITPKPKIVHMLCRGCKRSFKHPQDLHRHIAKQIGKRHTCDICGHSTYQAQLLEWHQVVHQSKKKYKCHCVLFNPNIDGLWTGT